MSTPSSPPEASSANYQYILNSALDSYARQTGIDLTIHPSAHRLQNCHSPEHVIQLLSERGTAFRGSRDKYINLTDRLRPVVQGIHAFSGVLGEAAGLVPFQLTKAIFVGIVVLLSTINGVSTNYNALLDLFERVANFFNHLHIYTGRSDIVVMIMAKVLSMLAIATKRINQGQLSKNDVEAIIQRLD